MALTQPVEETLSAGRSFLVLGQRFGSWIRSMVKSVNSSNLETNAAVDHEA